MAFWSIPRVGHAKQRMPAAAIEQMRLAAIGPVDDAGRLLRQRSDDDVAAAIRDLLLEFQRRPDREIDEDVGVGLHEPVERVLYAELGTVDHAVRRADAQPAGQAAARRADAVPEIIEIAEQLLRRVIGRLADFRQAELLAPAMAELAADALLQLRQMRAQGRLRQVEGDLRPGKAAGIGKRHEDAQQADVDVVQPAHAVSPSAMHRRYSMQASK